MAIIVSFILGELADAKWKKDEWVPVWTAVTVLMLYVNSLHYIRGISGFSWLITVLYEIASESRYFIGLIAILVIGFTTSFHALGKYYQWYLS